MTIETTDDTDDNNQCKLSEGDRRQAHRALDVWLDECEREAAEAFSDGHSGYVGRIKLCGFVNDEGVFLRIERSFTRDL